MADKKAYPSLFEEEEVSLKEYRKELDEIVAGRIPHFDPNHPLKGMDLCESVKRAVGVSEGDWLSLYVKPALRRETHPVRPDLAEEILCSRCGIGSNMFEKYTAGLSATRREEISTKTFSKIVGAVVELQADYRKKKGLRPQAPHEARMNAACGLMGVSDPFDHSRESAIEDRAAKIYCIAAMASLLDEKGLDFLLHAATCAGGASNARPKRVFGAPGATYWRTTAEELAEIRQPDYGLKLRGDCFMYGGEIERVLDILSNEDGPYRDYYAAVLCEGWVPVCDDEGNVIDVERRPEPREITLREYFEILELAAQNGDEALAKALFDAIPPANRVLSNTDRA